MAFDIIAFSQEELARALNAGIRSIALCDNSFSLPDAQGVHYTIMGSVIIESASVPETRTAVSQPTSAYSGSFGGSYSGSFLGGSGSSGFMYEYEYEFGGSYTASYASSYQALYISSYAASYTASYSYLGGMSYEWGGSYGIGTSRGIGSGSYITGAAVVCAEQNINAGVVLVNGYGINLI